MKKKDFIIGIFTGSVVTLVIAIVGIFIYFSMANSVGVIPEGIVSDDSASNNSSDGEYILQDAEFVYKMKVVEEMIDKYYIDSVSNSTLQEGVFDGMLASLGDPYAAYYSKEELEALMSDTEGKYYGIGAYVMEDTETNYPKVTGIIENSPSESSELRIDDYITEVDGTDVYNMELEEAVALIKGPKGTKVHLKVYRPSIKKSLDIEIERDEVETPTVNYEKLDGDIAYIAISQFDEVTVDQFAESLADARSDEAKGLILDLRGNPGGSLSAVVKIARQILPEGKIVYTIDKYGKEKVFESDGANELDMPMVVLINGGSASASEILAGAIKDYGIGTLMGTTTFGKGIVQQVISMSDSSAIKVTVSHYYTPKGNDIHKVGIEPDIEVPFDVEAYLEDVDNDNQLDEAIKEVTKMIENK